MGDAAGVVCMEASDDLPAGADDAHVSIIATEEQAIGAGADARYLAALEEGSRLVVAGFDLADLEEVECFPLRKEKGSVRLAAFKATIKEQSEQNRKTNTNQKQGHGRWLE